jgi:hypothetical protein
MVPGKHTINGSNRLNVKRLSMSAYKSASPNKNRRKVKRGQKYKKDDKNEQKEGNMYEAGAH